MRHFFTTLFIALLPFILHAQLQPVNSVATGFWNNPAIWSTGVVPDSNSLVMISFGDTVKLPDNSARYYCRTLNVQYEGMLQLRRSNFEALDSVMVTGILVDSSNTGTNIFHGRMIVMPAGRLDTRKIISETRQVYKNGIKMEGDSALLGRCLLTTRDQRISGYRPVVLYNSMVIDSALTLINENTSGMIFEKGTVTSRDSGTYFINLTTINSRYYNYPMEEGEADFTHPDNVVIYSGISSLNIRPGYYERLIIAGEDTVNYSVERNMAGALRARNMEVLSKARLLTRSHSLQVDDELKITGTVYDSDSLGNMEFNDVLLGTGGIIQGSGGFNYGIIHVNGDLILTGNGEISSVYLDVTGETRIKQYNRLTLKTGVGPKYFNRVVLESGSRFYFQGSSGPNLYFRKPVYSSGEFQLEGGNFYFRDSLIFRPEGSLNAKAAKVNLYITKYWRQDGLCVPSPSNFFCEGLVEGLVPIQISGVLRIPSGKTLINNAVGGFSITGKLEGADETSVFINKTLLAYGPSSDLSPPMDTGVFDITLPGNTVSFNSNASKQEIPAMTYQNILFEKGTPKYLRQGDIQIEGNVSISSFVQKAPTALTLNRVLLTGSGDQLILGNGEGTFEGLEIKKPSGKVIASSTFTVGDVLFMTRGVILADPGVLLLGGAAQILESDSSYVTGQLASQRRINEGSSNNFGGMGIKIKAAATKPIGQLIVIRTTGKSLEPGQIERYFEIIPTNNTGLDATVEFFYHSRDLNGADETDVEVESKAGTGDFTTLEAYLYEPDTNRITIQDIDEFGFLSARPKTLAINAFPNPFDEDPLTLQFVLPVAGEARVSIYDTRGALRYEDKFQAEAGKTTLVLSDLPIGPGLYFARVVSGKKDGTHLFVKLNR